MIRSVRSVARPLACSRRSTPVACACWISAPLPMRYAGSGNLDLSRGPIAPPALIWTVRYPAGMSKGRRFDPDPVELRELFQTRSLRELAHHYGVSQSVVQRRVKEHGITLAAGRRPRSDTHRQNLSLARKGKRSAEDHPNWKGGQVSLQCRVCGKAFNVRPARASLAKYCSNACRGIGHGRQFSGEASPTWRNAALTRACRHCGKEFRTYQPQQIYCSRSCSDVAAVRYRGTRHPRYNPDSRHRGRGTKYEKWCDIVLARDNHTCRDCGAQNVELHAHHIHSFKDHPNLRFDADNGLTLCYRCHWRVHGIDGSDNGRQLAAPVEILLGKKMGRRWIGTCRECGVSVSRAWGHVKGKANVYCSRKCAGLALSRAKKGIPRAATGKSTLASR